jgi:hypothetical protein
MKNIRLLRSDEPANPQLKQLAVHASELIKLRLEKSLANHAAPAGKLPGDAPDALDRLVVGQLAMLPRPHRQALTAKVLPQIRPDVALRDLKLKAEANLQQSVARLKLEEVHPLMPGWIARLKAGEKLDKVIVQPRGLAVSEIRFRIREIFCEKDTREAGKDEIVLGGVATADSGQATKIQWPALKFKKGDRLRAADLPDDGLFTTFSLEGGFFPKAFQVTLVLAEKDLGKGVTNFLTALANGVIQEATKLLKKLLEDMITSGLAGLGVGITVGSAGGPLGVLIAGIIGGLIGFVTGLVLGLLKQWLGDDIFPVNAAPIIVVDSPDFNFGGDLDSPDFEVTFNGFGGIYRVKWDLQLEQ